MNDEALARDVIRDWPRRSVVGHALVSRLGARAWDAPRFAKGRKLFPKFGLPDPWDPGAPVVDIGLGDVALPERRAVAPHAAPPPAPGTAPKPGLPNLPRAPQRGEADPAPKGKPAPQIGEVRKFDPSELTPQAKTTAGRPQAPPKKPENPRAFGSAPVKHAVAKLPVRPGFGPAAEPGAPLEPVPPAP
ncbi:MAG: hypothetical protein FJ090_22270, partial [Deltaproteobacteria bacterium]|nr:hypothetical protein [Deltaproteobacteria bacterium]